MEMVIRWLADRKLYAAYLRMDGIKLAEGKTREEAATNARHAHPKLQLWVR